MSNRARGLLFLLAVSSFLAGCSDRPEKAGRDSTGEVLLYCGAGIRPPVAELTRIFEEENSVRFATDYAGSGTLVAKIKIAQQGDLFMPGDVFYVDLLADQVISRKTVCYFIPVILVQKGNPKNIRSLGDLFREDVKLGLGDAKACAVGKKSRKLLEKNGFDTESVDRHLAFQSQTVNELGMQIQAQSLDAVIVWDSIARYYVDHGDIVTIPAEQNIISTIAVGLLKSAKEPQAAREFMDFLTSEEGKAVFRKHNYTVELSERHQ